ncbi:MAG TPA: diaminopimelate decarboxylase [Actinomycetes bacterium]|nr:diaminopimelate decarboxylase [Actinomycetes bacterium]
MRVHPAGPRSGELAHEGPHGGPPADLSALDAAVWPRGAGRAATGARTLRGHDVRDLVAEHGSPVFLLDEADLRSRCRDYREAFGGAMVFYAAKAFLTTTVARWVEEEGLGLDVCTGGELAVAVRAGFPGERMLLHGNNKSSAELAAALDAGVGRVVVDSLQEVERLSALCVSRGVTQRVLVRVTVGVEAHTHEFIATAHEDQKFGFSLAGGEALAAVRAVRDAAGLELVGLHSHIGSQIFDAGGFEVAAHRVVGLLADVRDRFGAVLGELNLGGGLGIAYTSADDPADVRAMGRSLADIVDRECLAAGLPVPSLAIEPGRGIVGPGTVTVYAVGTVKEVEGLRTFVSVDGGMSDNIRTALYDADYTVTLASRTSDAPPMLARVVGKHCESGDVVVKDAWLPADVGPGDLLAVAATGAYCRSMASTYNHVPRPPVVAVTDMGSTVLLRRETLDDLMALDAGVGRPEGD